MNDLFRRVTALGRPLDPEWSTNRAVMALMPAGALGAWCWFLVSGEARPPLAVALLAGAVVLVGWALGRELAPDRQGAAFVSMALAWLAFVLEPGASLLVAVVGLMSARLVNRTTGLDPTWIDTAGAVGLVAWAVIETNNPFFAVGAHVAFVADAALPGGLRRHALIAPLVLALGPAAAWGVLPGTGAPVWQVPSGATLFAVGVVAVAFVRTVLATHVVESRADDTGAPLDPRRVRGGMWAVLAVALPGLAMGDAGAVGGLLLWASMAGVSVGVPRR